MEKEVAGGMSIREIRDILMSVRNPFRYVGGEVGSRRKDWDGAEIRACLAFPDAYELGMSHLGLSILYHLLNDQPGMLCERAFAPWADMEAALVRRGFPLFSLESHRPLADFDIVGFSLGYELTYTNVLAMLRLAGIPLRAEARSAKHEARWPLVIAGGPCAFNPLPIAPFFDAIVIGDGEQAVLEITRMVASAKRRETPCRALLEELSNIRGVFVPSVHRSRDRGVVVGKATIPDLDAAPFPHTPVVAHLATQERLAIEAARGCARGCRFCQAGFIYRPVRQRSGAVAVELASRGLASSGAEEFSFLSLSVGDWAPLGKALAGVHARCGTMPVGATLPSLRAESLTQDILDALGRARAGSFTLAPEAGTERMRRLINKGNTDADLYASVENVFASGWHAVKLYFMVGLPGETAADVDGICEIANRCLDIGRRHHRRPEVTISTSTFVPKAHTPFQWEVQISIEEALSIQHVLKKRLRRPGLFYRWHDAEMSFLEGVFSRGGEELSAAIEIAAESGARFDGWDECFDIKRWREAFSKAGIEPERYLCARRREEAFPWEALGAGPDRDFLWRERERAFELQATPDCTIGECARCGMCDFEEVKNKIAARSHLINGISSRAMLCERRVNSPLSVAPEARRRGAGEPPAPEAASRSEQSIARLPVFRYRLRYAKEGRAAFLGSIEALDALRRALRASGLPLVYSEGYHPRPRIAVGPALPVGIESRAEFADIWLTGEMGPERIVQSLVGRFPEGMEAMGVVPIEMEAASLEEAMARVRYEADLSGTGIDPEPICRRFAEIASWPIARVRKGRAREVDLKESIDALAAAEAGVLGVSILMRPPHLRVTEVVAALAGLDDEAMRKVRIRKVEVTW